MDTSVEYIKMCRQAEEIQEKGREIGAFNCKQTFIKYLSEGCANVCVWLPRQDQLQDMLDGEPLDKFHQLYAFGNNGSANLLCTRLHEFKTLEQFWLAFVMYKKFGKTWNGQKWIIPSIG